MKTEEMTEIGLGMSNLDHAIDEGFAEALMAQPGKVFGRHAGWNFNGCVYFEGEMFHEEVWVYRVRQETITAKTLRELMTRVCDKYGYD